MKIRRFISQACVPLVAALIGGYVSALMTGNAHLPLALVSPAQAQASCPTTLPPSTNFTGAGITQGQFKTAITNLVSYLTCVLGTDGTTATAKSTLGLATVASTGAYSDLSGTPTGLPPTGSAGGDLNGSYPNPTLGSAGTPGTYAYPASVTTDSKGRVTSITAGSAPSSAGPEASLASASTTDLGSTGVNVVQITGTTTITSFGSSASTSNPIYFIRFASALTLTHNATNLIIPGAANITTAANDNAIVKYEGSGHWRLLLYKAAANRPIPALAAGTYGATDGSQAIGQIIINSEGRVTGLTTITGLSGSGGGGGGGGTCFMLDAYVTMRGGRRKRLADVRIGEQVSDGRGGWNTVIGIDRTTVSGRLMARLNGEHWTSCEHPHMRADGSFAALDVDAIYGEWGAEHALVIEGGAVVRRKIVGLEPGRVTPMIAGQSLLKQHGPCPLITIELFDDFPEDTPLGNLAVDGSGTYVVDDYVVTGWPDHTRWDFDRWEPRSAQIEAVRALEPV